jgi:hypothetical protein
MADWAEDVWDEDEAWLEARWRRRTAGQEQRREGGPPSVAPLQEELPGSVYYVPHDVWNVPTRQPKDRPGVCVGCDVPGRWAWLYRGIDASSPVVRSHETILVPPSGANGLKKLTAFLVEPQGVRLHRLMTFHSHPRLVGRLEDVYFQPMQERFLQIVQANRRGDA